MAGVIMLINYEYFNKVVAEAFSAIGKGCSNGIRISYV